MDIRRATASDLDAVVAIIEGQRKQYQKFQPAFWHKAADSAATTKAFFTKLLIEAPAYFLVAVEGNQVLGFLIARKFPAPPVFVPGGDIWLIDDFAVSEPRHWLTIGEALLSHVSTLLHEHGAAQIVAVCADRDLAKVEVLRRSDLTIASNWWTKPLR
ncbi:MAG: GNAT family N-acetyltransferase [Reyranella sp.]|uniref:GNAT family N-acetyltransferase n=1 Tax=Reyranella sp. TaxID=1929291 RepID=UPI001AC3D49F|nr:GNAT family N-acetyltransferase [Reyranella sp.]MBN9088431.1 GNAT family N-acetyltransferase [Reyranella sp.]